MEFDAEALLLTFIAETEENLRVMEEGLLSLERHPDDPEVLQTIFRMAHTLKGNSASLGFTGVAEFAHALEDQLERLRKRTRVGVGRVRHGPARGDRRAARDAAGRRRGQPRDLHPRTRRCSRRLADSDSGGDGRGRAPRGLRPPPKPPAPSSRAARCASPSTSSTGS